MLQIVYTSKTNLLQITGSPHSKQYIKHCLSNLHQTSQQIFSSPGTEGEPAQFLLSEQATQ